MAINFPSTPTLNQIYAEGQRQWRWNGSAWDLDTAILPVGPTGPAGVSLNILGEVTNIGDLPGSANFNDAYVVTSTKDLYIYNGSSWYMAGQFTGNTGATGPTGPLSFKSISIENPDPGERIPFFYNINNVYVSKITSIVLGTSPTATFSVQYGSDLSQNGTEIVVGGINTTSNTVGNIVTVFNNSFIPAYNYVWVYVSNSSPTTDWLNITIEF